MKRIAVLGATGSIGTSTLEVLAAARDRMTLHAASAHSNWRGLAGLLGESFAERPPKTVVLSGSGSSGEVDAAAFPAGCDLRFGPDALCEAATDPEVDVLVAAIMGSAGLESTWEAVAAGKTVALANKEPLVVAGPLLTAKARETKAELRPVDSEHNAVAQAIRSGRRSEVRRVVLTASGGPFRGRSRAELESVTPEDALKHPTWEMGRKITIDSATLMNKALEVIEARWLFDLSADQIEVAVHPQSIVHSLVEFVDGSVVAQLSPPDMRLPIQYALDEPERREGLTERMDFASSFSLDFEPPDREAFPALDLGFEVARRGGTCGVVLNAANEVAVDRFLAGELPFLDIARLCRAMLEHHTYDPTPSLADLARLESHIRQEARRWHR